MAKYERVGSVYRKKDNPWPVVIGIVIMLIVIGAAIG